MRLCFLHIEGQKCSCLIKPQFHFGTVLNRIWGCFIFAVFIFAIQEKNADVEKFLIKPNLKETYLYEKPVVHGNKIDRVKELVDVGVVGRFCLRFGANSWI